VDGSTGAFDSAFFDFFVGLGDCPNFLLLLLEAIDCQLPSLLT
jgi:hypothetical protein